MTSHVRGTGVHGKRLILLLYIVMPCHAIGCRACSSVCFAVSAAQATKAYTVLARVQVADYMADASAVRDDVRALARACRKHAWIATSDSVNSSASYTHSEASTAPLTAALLSLSSHHLYALFRCLLMTATTLRELLEELPFALHRPLLHAAATMPSTVCIGERAHAASAGASKLTNGAVNAELVLREPAFIAAESAIHCTGSLRAALSARSCAALCAQLPFAPQLAAVDLSGQMVLRTEDAFAALVLALSLQPSLTRLDFSEIAGIQAAGAIARHLHRWPALAELHMPLTRPGYSPPIDDSETADTLARGLRGLSNLTHVNLRGNELSAALASALGALPQLQRLALGNVASSNSSFYEHAGSALACTRLCSLDLAIAKSPLYSKVYSTQKLDMRLLAPKMLQCEALTRLDLANGVLNDLAPLCFAALPRLAHLDLSGCSKDSEMQQVVDGDINEDAEPPPPGVPDMSQRHGVRGLVHLHCLTFLSIGDPKHTFMYAFARALRVALAALPRLHTFCHLGGSCTAGRELPMGWVRAPALRALTCQVGRAGGVLQAVSVWPDGYAMLSRLRKLRVTFDLTLIESTAGAVMPGRWKRALSTLTGLTSLSLEVRVRVLRLGAANLSSVHRMSPSHPREATSCCSMNLHRRTCGCFALRRSWALAQLHRTCALVCVIAVPCLQTPELSRPAAARILKDVWTIFGGLKRFVALAELRLCNLQAFSDGAVADLMSVNDTLPALTRLEFDGCRLRTPELALFECISIPRVRHFAVENCMLTCGMIETFIEEESHDPDELRCLGTFSLAGARRDACFSVRSCCCFAAVRTCSLASAMHKGQPAATVLHMRSIVQACVQMRIPTTGWRISLASPSSWSGPAQPQLRGSCCPARGIRPWSATCGSSKTSTWTRKLPSLGAGAGARARAETTDRSKGLSI